MPQPWSMISTYAPESIDSIISKNGFKQLCVFVDLKNILTSIFIEQVCDEIMCVSNNQRKLDSSIFQSILAYSAYWKEFGFRRGLPIKIIFCTDIGISSYHLAIDKDYKESRVITTSTSPVQSEFMKEIRDKNFLLVENICNRLSDIYFFCLKFLESDFLPYYIITRKLNHLDNTLFIVCSNDKDLLQTVIKPNIIMINKKRGIRNLVDQETALVNYLQLNRMSSKTSIKLSGAVSRLRAEHIPMLMAIVGDPGDDVKGVNGIGPIKAAEFFGETIIGDLIGDYDSLNNRVDSGGKFFLEDRIGISQIPKKWQKIFLENNLVTNSYKLVSFEMLSRWLDKVDSLDKIKHKSYIEKMLSKKDQSLINDSNYLLESLTSLEDLYLEPKNIESLFKPIYRRS